MKIIAPNHFNANTVDEFLRKVEPIFQGRSFGELRLDLSRIKDISIIGLLLVYKFIDYTSQKVQVADGYIDTGPYIRQAWEDYQFMELINAYIKRQEATEKDYKELKVSVKDNFIIAPQALLRDTDYTKTYLQNEFLPKISKYYSNNSQIQEMIFTCVSEILLNFWQHAVDDTKSIILADGTKHKIEIACADTGEGIISNLLPYFPDLASTKEKVLEKALQKGVTSKKGTNHMGYGLFLVEELVKMNSGRLHLYSQGFYYKNDFGKIRQGKTGYWPGTIIYVNLSLKNPLTISQSELANNKDLENIKINFI